MLLTYNVVMRMLEGCFTKRGSMIWGTGSKQAEYLQTQCHSTAVFSEKLHVIFTYRHS